MTISRLQISGIRNLNDVVIPECGRVNVFCGHNGSGKTSILEAIFILSRARSFRTHKLNTVINHLATRCVVYGELSEGGSMGVMRSRNEKQVFKVNGNPVYSAAELAEQLPLQLINANSFSLLEGGPSLRRQFLDWGVFHVEHDFWFYWKRIQKALKQRNSLLRRGRIQDAEILPWDTELSQCAEIIDGMRAAYIRRLQPHFQAILASLTQLEQPELIYQRGWNMEQPLIEVLQHDRQRDLQQGSTLHGPQRADIVIKIAGRSAEDVLSRGQEKLLACALRLAQGVLLHELTGQTCTYLVDDLPAELDVTHRKSLCKQLSSMRSQVFVTAPEAQSLAECWPNTEQTKWFHVEHGVVSPTSAP